MSEVAVRLANEEDSRPIIELLNSKENKAEESRCTLYTDQSFQKLLSNKSHQVFVAEQDDQLSAVVITCVVDAGTTLVIKDIRTEGSFHGSEMLSVLLMGMYQYLGPNFSRLRRERFVSSCKDVMTHLDIDHNPYFKQPASAANFTKVFELKQQIFKFEDSSILMKKIDDLANVQDLFLVHLTKKEADSYILRNLSCFCGHTLVVNSVPYMPLLSSSSSIFTESDYLLGEKQSDQKDALSPTLRVPSSTNGISSGRNSPSRFLSSHATNVLDSLHTSLRNMGENLQNLKDNLFNAKPKSFSHGKEQSDSKGNKSWIATIYSEDAKVFRAHILDQLRVATLRIKTKYALTLNCSSAMSNEARSLFTQELGLALKDHVRESIEVYDRPIDFSISNGKMLFSP